MIEKIKAFFGFGPKTDVSDGVIAKLSPEVLQVVDLLGQDEAFKETTLNERVALASTPAFRLMYLQTRPKE